MCKWCGWLISQPLFLRLGQRCVYAEWYSFFRKTKRMGKLYGKHNLVDFIFSVVAITLGALEKVEMV